jgi:hypothetical protein
VLQAICRLGAWVGEFCVGNFGSYAVYHMVYQAQNGVLSLEQLRCPAGRLGAWVGHFVWVTLASIKWLPLVLAKLKFGDLNVYCHRHACVH